MPGKQSAIVTKALRLISKGRSVHGVAVELGISPSTLFRARKRLEQKELALVRNRA